MEALRPHRITPALRRPLRLTLLLLAATLGASAPSASAATLPAGFEEINLASGLASPSSVAWAPDGRMFTNQGGNLKVYPPGSATGTTFHAVAGFTYSIALDASFASNGYMYAFYASDDNARLVRFTVGPGNTVSNQVILLGKAPLGPCPAPSNTVDCIPNKGSNHVAGKVISDPRDGTLWVSQGDNASPGFVDPLAFNAQNEQSYAGKILHIDRNGNGLPGHAFCPSDTTLTHVCTKVHARGMRNSYRFSLRPGSAGLVAGDTGWESREEVTLIKSAGNNYGWPCYEGTIRTPGYRDDSRCAALYAKEGTSQAALGPVYEYSRPTNGSAIIGGPTYVGSGYPADYKNDIFFADYVQGYIKRLQLDASDKLVAVKPFATGVAGAVDLQIAPSGDLAYVNFTTGTINRIRFAGATNRAPVAAAAANPTSGPAPLNVSFSSAGSSDPDGDAITFDWNFGDGSTHSTAANPSHTYTDGSRNFTATLTVTDSKGVSDSESITISPGNRAPTARITAPATYRNGTVVNVSGSATDPDQGNLPPSALAWDMKLIHIDHEHLAPSPSGVADASFTAATDHDADSFYRVTLTATDSRGVKDTDTVEIRPQTTTFTLASSPSGAEVTYKATNHIAPFTTTSAIGFRTSVSAVQSFTTGGKNYEFASWSDGGARLHDITIPASPSTLTATYREGAGPPSTEDKARGRPATSSSVKDGTGWGPELAVDGNSATRWSSAWGVDNQWWQVDLGSARQVDRVTLDWFTSYATRYLISTSTNGTSFTQAADVTNNAAGPKTTTFAARSARYVRVTGVTRAVPQYGISFWTASVFGPADTAPPPPGAKALLVVRNAAALQASDEAVRSRLAAAGYTVTVRSESAPAADATGKDVVLISSTVAPAQVAARFRPVAVPVLLWEAELLDDMGMAPGPGAFAAGQTSLNITSPSHPMAAGLTGTRTVTSGASPFAWGAPTASAVKVATLAGDSTKSTIFGYNAGAAMVGLNAPARRVGFFFSNSNPTLATTDGWRLFDAAVGWARTGS